MKRKIYLSIELFILFIGIPLFIHIFQLHRFFLPVLWVFSIICYYLLKNDKDFDSRNLNRKEAFTKTNIKKILRLFIVAVILLGIGTYIVLPDRFLGLLLDRPYWWIIIMVLYPLLSVYPQEIIYRAFFFYRYRSILGKDLNILISSSILFGYAHVIFGNWFSVLMCVIGGLIFGRNYLENKSLMLVWFEHSLYGCLIFTVGLGWYFYHGSVGVPLPK